MRLGCRLNENTCWLKHRPRLESPVFKLTLELDHYFICCSRLACLRDSVTPVPIRGPVYDVWDTYLQLAGKVYLDTDLSESFFLLTRANSYTQLFIYLYTSIVNEKGRIVHLHLLSLWGDLILSLHLICFIIWCEIECWMI